MLALLDASDPPIWINSDKQPETAPTNIAILYHHPYHAREVMERAAAVKVPHSANIPKLGITTPGHPSIVDFMLKHVKGP